MKATERPQRKYVVMVRLDLTVPDARFVVGALRRYASENIGLDANTAIDNRVLCDTAERVECDLENNPEQIVLELGVMDALVVQQALRALAEQHRDMGHIDGHASMIYAFIANQTLFKVAERIEWARDEATRDILINSVNRR